MQDPWAAFRQAPLEFCEETLDGWIKQPANTWTNVAFVVAAVWIWRNTRQPSELHLRTIALVALCTGLGSAFYHASGTWLGALADYTGMFMSGALMVAFNVRRWLGWPFPLVYATFATLTAVFLLTMVCFPGSERWVFALGSPCWVIEIRLFLRDRHRTRYRHYVTGVAAIAGASTFWVLDAQRILCVPDNHVFTAHSMWHVLLAVAFVSFHRFYAQFEALRAARPDRAGTGAR